VPSAALYTDLRVYTNRKSCINNFQLLHEWSIYCLTSNSVNTGTDVEAASKQLSLWWDTWCVKQGKNTHTEGVQGNIGGEVTGRWSKLRTDELQNSAWLCVATSVHTWQFQFWFCAVDRNFFSPLKRPEWLWGNPGSVSDIWALNRVQMARGSNLTTAIQCRCQEGNNIHALLHDPPLG
jgi:hypothetical protein